MRLSGGKKAAIDLLEFGGNDDDVVSLLPEEPEDMVSVA